MAEAPVTTTRFDELALVPALIKGIKEAGFESCTPIQEKALPIALQGKDVAGQAQTGTGKTAAFLLATLNHLLTHDAPVHHRDGQPRALILAPTRELAVQIYKDLDVLSRHTEIRSVVAFGGTGYHQQREDIEAGIDILVGTPGRVIDYYKQKVFGLNSIQVCVLDEADRMFDLGFIKDIRYVLRRMPPATERLNMLFSATLSHRVAELAYEHMNAPESVDASDDQVTVSKIEQILYHVSKEEKIPLLLGLLAKAQVSRTIVFCNTKRACERVSDYLAANSISSGLLTGDVPQKKRLSLLERFKKGAVDVLVATDVAARGLHIDDVTHVFNYDLPQDAEDYVHRVGRTARAGASGDAVSLACEEYVYSLIDIEDFIGHKLPVGAVEPDMLVEPKRPPRGSRTNYGDRAGGNRKGRSGSGRSDSNRSRSGSSSGDGAGTKKPRRPRRGSKPSANGTEGKGEVAQSADSAESVASAPVVDPAAN